MLRLAVVAICLSHVTAFLPRAPLDRLVSTAQCRRASSVVMMAAEDPIRNTMRSARKPGPNDRVVEVTKPLGLVLEEDERGNVYVKDIQPGSNAARQAGDKIQRGDLISMISATFGDEMWSARGAGLGMIMQAIKVRQGSKVTLVLDGAKSTAQAPKKAPVVAPKVTSAADAAKKEAALLKQLEAEEAGKKKKFLGLF